VRVLQIHHSDNPRWGGGIIAMLRLHDALRAAGIDTRILCGIKTLPGAESVEVPRRRWVEAALRRAGRRLGLNDLHGLGAFGIARHPLFRAADVVHVQGLHGGYFNFLALPRLARAKPLVYTLHDMWPLTGHCAYSYGCDRWRRGCGACPHLDAPPPVTRDATRLEWQLKDWTYRRSRLTVVAVSQWMAGLAGAGMLGRFPVRVIPNGVDTEVYRPLDREHCRALLGVPRGTRILLWLSSWTDPRSPDGFRKGGDLLLKALEGLPAGLKRELLLLVVGGQGETVGETAGVRVLNLGFVASDRLKALAYAAADVFVHPTRADNAPLTLLESLACGTPCVSFRVGGVPEIVRPGETGALAEPEDAEGLGERIVMLLEDAGLRGRLGEQARAVAVAEYSLELHLKRHLDLYHQLTDAA
jgi:glycosyltransferase involved in cell wall biosynthesis